MKNCDELFQKARAVPDPRLKVSLMDNGGINWKYQDMNPVTAREILKRLVTHLRMTDIYQSSLGIVVHEKAGPMMQVEYLIDMPEATICVAHHPASGAVQAAVSGMTIFQACILCDSVSNELDIINTRDEVGTTV